MELLQESQQECLLDVKAILCLIKNNRLIGLHHTVRYFESALGGEAMHKDGIAAGSAHQLSVHLVRREDPFSLFALGLLAHADPDIGVDRVG
jgi:hypothetical protein